LIVLNEREYIEQFINDDKKQIDNMYYTLSLLARYYKNQLDSKNVDIRKQLETFLSKYGEDIDDWQDSLDKIIKKCDRPLVEIEFISVSKNELETIKQVKNRRLEKLLFTMLCLAKFNNIVNEKNNNWVNRDVKEIFKLANVRDNIKKQYISISEIKDLGLIKFSKKVDNLNLCVKFIDNGEIELEIDDFRDLGFQYLAYLGENYIKCECCGRLVKRTGKRDKYCKECSYLKQLQWSNNYKNNVKLK